jgi:hypothetical protein
MQHHPIATTSHTIKNHVPPRHRHLAGSINGQWKRRSDDELDNAGRRQARQAFGIGACRDTV